MFAELLLRDSNPKLICTDAGQAITVLVRLNWYRSVPLSCVEEIDLSLDDVPLGGVEMTLGVDGHTVPVRLLAECDDIWWFPLDQALLTSPLAAPIDPTRPHVLKYAIKTRIPYFPQRPDGSWGTLNDVATMEVRL